MFPTSPIIHVGFDEAFGSCWGITKDEALKMQNSFLDTIANYITEKSQPNPRMIAHWDDMAADGYYDPKDGKSKRVYQNWKSASNLKGIFENSDSAVIVSAAEYLYFDGGQSNYLTGMGMNWDSPRKEWKTIYSLTIPDELMQYNDRILGAEACLWGEGHDQTNLIQEIFPRLSALGELLWTEPAWRKADPLARLIQHRNMLVGRGIPA